MMDTLTDPWAMLILGIFGLFVYGAWPDKETLKLRREERESV